VSGARCGSRPRMVRHPDDRGAIMPETTKPIEYIELLGSTPDGQVFDRVPAVAERCQPRRTQPPFEFWTFGRCMRAVRPVTRVRIQAGAPLRLRWTGDEWAGVEDSASRPTALGIDFVDVPVALVQTALVCFRFSWPEAGRWEGRDFAISVDNRG
jgi:hypothetical protein